MHKKWQQKPDLVLQLSYVVKVLNSRSLICSADMGFSYSLSDQTPYERELTLENVSITFYGTYHSVIICSIFDPLPFTKVSER